MRTIFLPLSALLTSCAAIHAPSPFQPANPCYQVMPADLGDTASANGSTVTSDAAYDAYLRRVSAAGLEKCLEWRASHGGAEFTQEEMAKRMEEYRKLPGW
jgi:hypothetical protein